jgi:hypothetical protein
MPGSLSRLFRALLAEMPRCCDLKQKIDSSR